VLKLVAIGVWVILICAGATFGSAYFSGNGEAEKTPEESDLGLEELKSEMTSIPVMRNGDVVGYVILQLSFAADRGILEKVKLDPLPFINDAAFRVIFASTDIEFRRLRRENIDALTVAIAKEANARIGAELVRHVLVQQVNFVNKEDIRTNWIGGSDSPK